MPNSAQILGIRPLTIGLRIFFKSAEFGVAPWITSVLIVCCSIYKRLRKFVRKHLYDEHLFENTCSNGHLFDKTLRVFSRVPKTLNASPPPPPSCFVGRNSFFFILTGDFFSIRTIPNSGWSSVRTIHHSNKYLLEKCPFEQTSIRINVHSIKRLSNWVFSNKCPKPTYKTA